MSLERKHLRFIQKQTFANHMQMLMNITESDGKNEYLIIQKGTKLMGSDKLQLKT